MINFKVLITISKIALMTPFVFPYVTQNNFQWKLSVRRGWCRREMLKLLAPHHTVFCVHVYNVDPICIIFDQFCEIVARTTIQWKDRLTFTKVAQFQAQLFRLQYFSTPLPPLPLQAICICSWCRTSRVDIACLTVGTVSPTPRLPPLHRWSGFLSDGPCLL